MAIFDNHSNEKILRKRLAAKIRQQRCRERKRAATLKEGIERSPLTIKPTPHTVGQSSTPVQSNKANEDKLILPLFPSTHWRDTKNTLPGSTFQKKYSYEYYRQGESCGQQHSQYTWCKWNRNISRQPQFQPQQTYRELKPLYPSSNPENAAIEAMLSLKSADQQGRDPTLAERINFQGYRYDRQPSRSSIRMGHQGMHYFFNAYCA